MTVIWGSTRRKTASTCRLHRAGHKKSLCIAIVSITQHPTVPRLFDYFFCCCWWPRVLRIKHSLFKSRARIQITRKYPLSSSGFSDFRLSYLQPLALVAPLPRTKKSVKKCIINATRSERSDSTHHNLDYLYITGLEGTEWLHSLKDNRLFRCLKLNSNKLPVRKQAQQVRMSYLDGRWSVKRHTAVSSGIP